MKDPHVHVEKDLVLRHATIRAAISAVTGYAPSAPKTIATGCGRRRPYAMTSTNPESVTCLACREWAQQKHAELADAAETAINLLPASLTDEKQAEFAQTIQQHRSLAAAFART